jgi:hypothetical protein
LGAGGAFAGAFLGEAVLVDGVGEVEGLACEHGEECRGLRAVGVVAVGLVWGHACAMSDERKVWVVGPQPEAVFDSREAAEAWAHGDDPVGSYVVYRAGEEVEPVVSTEFGVFGAG